MRKMRVWLLVNVTAFWRSERVKYCSCYF